MAVPTVNQVKAWLLDRHGVTATGDTTIQQAIAAAVARLERVTGYRPFEVAGAASSVDVLIQRGVGLFPNGAVGPVTVSLSGTTYVEHTDYRLVSVGRSPAQGLRWLRPTWPARPVAVLAAWGFAAEFPADVFLALVQHAAGTILAGKALGKVVLEGERWVDGDVSQSNAGAVSGGGGLRAVMGGQAIDEAEAVFVSYARSVAWG